MMVRQHLAANAGDVEEGQVAGQKPVHRRLVGGIEDRPTGAAATRYLIS
jgi:hypothetical protein